MIGAILVFCGAVALVVTYLAVVQRFLRAGEKNDEGDGGTGTFEGRSQVQSDRSATYTPPLHAHPAGESFRHRHPDAKAA